MSEWNYQMGLSENDALYSAGLSEQFKGAFQQWGVATFRGGSTGGVFPLRNLPQEICQLLMMESKQLYGMALNFSAEWGIRQRLLYGLCAVYWINSEGLEESCLGTCNPQILQEFRRRGLILKDIKDTAMNRLNPNPEMVGSKKVVSFYADDCKTDSLVFYKITPKTMEGSIKYELVKPRNSEAKKFKVVPLYCIRVIAQDFAQFASTRAMVITSRDLNNNEYRRVLTLNKDILANSYGKAVAERKVKYGNIGFSLGDFCIHAYDLQAPSDAIRTGAFGILHYCDINFAQENDLENDVKNDSEVFVRLHFNKVFASIYNDVSKRNTGDFRSLLTDLGVTDDVAVMGMGGTEEDERKFINMALIKAHSKPAVMLKRMMMKYPNLFGTNVSGDIMGITVNSLIGNASFEHRAVNSVEQMYALLRNGLVKVTYKKKDGNLKTSYCTLNDNILVLVYGKDYEEHYEKNGCYQVALRMLRMGVRPTELLEYCNKHEELVKAVEAVVVANGGESRSAYGVDDCRVVGTFASFSKALYDELKNRLSKLTRATSANANATLVSTKCIEAQPYLDGQEYRGFGYRVSFDLRNVVDVEFAGGRV